MVWQKLTFWKSIKKSINFQWLFLHFTLFPNIYLHQMANAYFFLPSFSRLASQTLGTHLTHSPLVHKQNTNCVMCMRDRASERKTNNTHSIRQSLKSFHNQFLPIHHKNEHISVMFFLAFYLASEKLCVFFCCLFSSFFLLFLFVFSSLCLILISVFLFWFHNNIKPLNLSACLWPI